MLQLEVASQNQSHTLEVFSHQGESHRTNPQSVTVCSAELFHVSENRTFLSSKLIIFHSDRNYSNENISCQRRGQEVSASDGEGMPGDPMEKGNSCLAPRCRDGFPHTESLADIILCINRPNWSLQIPLQTFEDPL